MDWQVWVEATVDGKESFVESGLLVNISSRGALFMLSNPLPDGAALDVYIKLPLQGKQWMKYPARVVRVESGSTAAAVKFDTARPDFGAPLLPVNS